MCKFEFKTYKQKKETVETFEDSVCNGIPKGRRMLKKAFVAHKTKLFKEREELRK